MVGAPAAVGACRSTPVGRDRPGAVTRREEPTQVEVRPQGIEPESQHVGLVAQPRQHGAGIEVGRSGGDRDEGTDPSAKPLGLDPRPTTHRIPLRECVTGVGGSIEACEDLRDRDLDVSSAGEAARGDRERSRLVDVSQAPPPR